MGRLRRLRRLRNPRPPWRPITQSQWPSLFIRWQCLPSGHSQSSLRNPSVGPELMAGLPCRTTGGLLRSLSRETATWQCPCAASCPPRCVLVRHRTPPMPGKMPGIKDGKWKNINNFNAYWRRERDSNPRYGCPHTRVPGVRLKPLGHLSGLYSGATIAIGALSARQQKWGLRTWTMARLRVNSDNRTGESGELESLANWRVWRTEEAGELKKPAGSRA